LTSTGPIWTIKAPLLSPSSYKYVLELHAPTVPQVEFDFLSELVTDR